MPTRQLSVKRFSVTSSRSFDEIIARLDSSIGHPEMAGFRTQAASARTYAELEEIVRKAVGLSGFMEFTRFDLGQVVQLRRGPRAPRSLRLVIGNPLIMEQMVERVPDAGSYAPVTILVDERPDGVQLTYDTMASCLSPYDSPEALGVAQDLDSKVETLLTVAAA